MLKNRHKFREPGAPTRTRSSTRPGRSYSAPGTPNAEDSTAPAPVPATTTPAPVGRVDPNNLPGDVNPNEWTYKTNYKYAPPSYTRTDRRTFDYSRRRAVHPSAPVPPVVVTPDDGGRVTVWDGFSRSHLGLVTIPSVPGAVAAMPVLPTADALVPGTTESKKGIPDPAAESGFIAGIINSKWLLPAAGVLGLALLL